MSLSYTHAMRAVHLVAITLSLAACGQTGSLYLPDEGVETPVEIRSPDEPVEDEEEKKPPQPPGS